MPSACPRSHKQEGQGGWLSQEDRAHSPLRLALAKGARSPSPQARAVLSRDSSLAPLQLSLACFPETRYAFAKPNRLWQGQVKISSAFVSLEPGPAQGTGRQPNPGRFSGCCRGPFAGFARAARCSRCDPGAPSRGARAERGCLPYPIGVATHAAASGVRVPRSSQGAADTASATARGPGS